MGSLFLFWLSRLLQSCVFLPALLVLFIVFPAVSQGDTLSPEAKRQIINDGYKAADQDQRIREIDDELGRGNLSQQERTRLQNEKADLERRINGKKGTAQVAGGQEGARLFDRAREARNKQWEKKALEDELSTATGSRKKRIQRTINRLDFELQNDYSDLGSLQDLPTASSSRSGSSQSSLGPNGGGTNDNALASRAGKIPQTFKLKGTANLSSGQNAAKTTVSLNNVTFNNLATATLVSPGETPEHFLDPSRDEDKDTGIGGRWPAGSEFAPNVSDFSVVGYEVVAAPDNFFYSHAYTAFNAEPFSDTTEVGGDVKLSVGIGYNFGSSSLALGAFYRRLTLKAEYQVDDIQVNDFDSNIYQYDSNFNLWRDSDEFRQEHGIDMTWSHLTHPIGNFTDFQQSETLKSQWEWRAPNSILNIEPNFGISGAPALGFHPESWPKTEASPVPRLTIRGVR